MPSKKAKGDEEPVKPLSFYVKDRLELTKQLFSCLKSKQIKSRLPKNIQNKSIERVQQICLDEILGISSKRLLSIINNTNCPADTESDSDIEHISLSEISSDDDISVVATNADKRAGTSKGQSGETTEKGPNEPKTMLELIELEARARAIRSQLALEPITKIELDDTEDEEVPEESPVTGPVASIVNAQPSKKKSSEGSKKSSTISTETAKKSLEAPKTANNAKESNSSKSTEESAKKTSEVTKRTSEVAKKDASKSTETFKKLSSSSNDKSKSRSERNIRPRKSPSPPQQPPPTTITKRVVVLKRSNRAELTITAPAPKTSVPPVKLKRNFSKTPSDTNISKTSENLSPKTSETLIPPQTSKEIETKIEEVITESRSSSPDIITMEQNISTYFISDTDDDEPPAKRKSTEKTPRKEKNITETVSQKSLDDEKSSKENEKSNNENNQEQSKGPSIEASIEVAVSSESTEINETSLTEEKTTDDVLKSSQESSKNNVEMAQEEIEPGEVISSPVLQSQTEQSNDGEDDNVVNLMSDTEIDPSDKEDEDVDTLTKESSMTDKSQVEKSKEVSQSNESDDDIVEILHSEDDLKQGEKSIKSSEDSETWNQRYLRSSTVKSVLKTTKLASKLRGKLAANKKSQKESIQKKKNEDKEKQKEFTEKISKLEEGSLEQFKGLKESSSSN